jgi:hypothetical protein
VPFINVEKGLIWNKFDTDLLLSFNQLYKLSGQRRFESAAS